LSIRAKIIVTGRAIRYYALCRGDRNDVQKFIDGLPENEECKVINYLVSTCETGIRNTETLRKEEGDIWAIRPPGSSVRLYFSYGRSAPREPRRIVIAHCVRKKRQKADPKALNKAQRLFEAFNLGGQRYEDG